MTKEARKSKSSNKTAPVIVEVLNRAVKVMGDESSISLGQLLASMKDQGTVLLLALISLPIAIPIPTPPGFTTLFGLPMCFLSAQLIFNRDKILLPSWITSRRIKATHLHKFIKVIEPKLLRIAVMLRPRFTLFTTRRFERCVGVMMFICSLSVALPIVGGNAVPSAGIFLMSLGLLYGDGLAVLLGIVLGGIGIAIAATVVYAFMKLVSWIKWKSLLSKSLFIWRR